MSELDLHTIFKELSRPHPATPRHKRQLRELLVAQARQQAKARQPLGTFRFTTLITGVSNIMSKKLLVAGASALAVAVLAIGIIAFAPQDSASAAAQLLDGASKSAHEMSQAEIDAVNGQYKQDLKNRLEEAKQNKSLQVLSEDDLAEWGLGKAKTDLAHYLGYRDANNHRIVIGLDNAKEPRIVFDADAAPAYDSAPTGEGVPASNGARTPSVQVN